MTGFLKPRRKRKRASLVCSNCKERKIKCDRKKPCSNCIKASIADSCVYTPNAGRLTSTGDKETPEVYKETDSIPCNLPPPICQSNVQQVISKNVENSILNKNIDIPRKIIIVRKPSNTQLRSSIFSCYSKNHILSSKFLFSFKHLLNKERDLWKSMKNKESKFQLSPLCLTEGSDNDRNKLVAKVSMLICSNYQAVLERLHYFQTKLNNILFESCIPMGTVQLIFLHYFTLKPTGAEFNVPNKAFEYSAIALIASIVELCNIFSKHDDINFNFPLPQQDNKFNELAVLLLNSSNIQRKRSIFSVYTLLVLRLSLMVYGDAQSSGINMQNSHPLFRTAVGISMDMGVHKDQDKVIYLHNIENDYYKKVCFAKEISVEQIKRLWNHLLLLDSIYFIDASIAPIIDDRFCHGYYRDIYGASTAVENFVNMIPRAACDFIGNSSTSLNALLSSVHQLTRFLHELPPVENFVSIEKNEEQWQLFVLKFKVLKLLFLYEFHINAVLDVENLTLNFSDFDLEKYDNKTLIETLTMECSLKCKLIYIIVLNTISKMSTASLGDKFIFYNKDIFSFWIGINTLAFIDLIVVKKPFAKSKQNYYYATKETTLDLSAVPNFDKLKLEEVLCDFSGAKGSTNLLEFERNCGIEVIVSFLIHVYENILHVKALFSDYNFFVMNKCLFFSTYLMLSYINSDDDSNNNFDKIKNLAQSLISKFSQYNRLTLLIPSEHLTKTTKNIKARTGVINSVDTQIIDSPTSTTSLPTVNLQTDSLSSVVNSESQFDDLFYSIFNDESITSLFKEMNDFFN